MAIEWKLKQVLESRGIRTTTLAEELGCHRTTASRLKHRKTLPRVDNGEIERLVALINQLAGPEAPPCRLSDLVVVVDEPKKRKRKK